MFKHIIFKIATVWLVLTQTLPPFNLLFPFGDAIKFAAYAGVTLLLFPSLLRKRSIIALFIYALVLLSYYEIGNKFFEDIFSAIIEPFVILSGLIIAEYTLKYDKEYKFTKLMVITVFASNIVMSIVTIPLLELHPNLIRMTTAGEAEEGYSNIFSYIIQYQTVHGLPFLFAPLVFLCKRTYKVDKKLFILWTLCGLMLFYIIFRSNAATSFLVSAMMIIVGFIFNVEKFTKKGFSQLVLIGLLGVFFIQPSVIEPIISTVQSTMNPYGAGYKRMEEVKESIVYGSSDGDLESRQNLYSNSFDLFLQSPLWGTSSPEKIGRHTWILDRLALLGLLFVVPIALVFVYNFRGFYKELIHTKVIYTWGFMGLILMLILKNSFNQGTWLYGFAYLPLFCRYIDNIIDKKSIIKSRLV